MNETQIAMMQSQLNPHFLYNTLDTMKWVAKANHIPEIATLAAKLAKILRTSISSAQFITLQEEMTLVESYAKIQKIRFNGKFDFRYEIAPETEEILVPKLIVQPIVENAVIHGLADADEGHIFVRAYLERKELVIEVSDDGCGISDEVIHRLLQCGYDHPASLWKRLRSQGRAAACRWNKGNDKNTGEWLRTACAQYGEQILMTDGEWKKGRGELL